MGADRVAALEKACRFHDAAAVALEIGDARRAVHLAALAADSELVLRCVDALAEAATPATLLGVGAELEAKGHAEAAAVLYDRGGDLKAAAQSFDAAGESVAAAQRYRALGLVVEAAKVLEAGLKTEPDDVSCRLMLGELLAEHGRVEAAIRVLQAHPTTSPGRRPILDQLIALMREKGFDHAAAELVTERARLVSEVGSPLRYELTAEPSQQPAHTTERVLFGRYAIQEQVAATASATVFRALDRVHQRLVAVKVLSGAVQAGRDWRSRFEREAQILRKLDHPAVVPLIDFQPDGPALVYAWMEGGSLEELLARETLAPRRSAEIAAAVLGALAESHRRGVLHRDVKPSNILFDGLGAARLADFGAGHLADSSATVTRGAIGTFATMAPEQRRGEPATVASDLYGVGAVLALMLTGTLPEPNEERIGSEVSACHPDLEPSHGSLLDSLLSHDPAGRPTDALTARSSILSLAWSPRVVERSEAPASARLSERVPREGRLVPPTHVGDGRDIERLAFDPWAGRNILVLGLQNEIVEAARSFARADRRALPTVLRLEPDAEILWVCAPHGRSLSESGAGPSKGAVDRFVDAVLHLHEVGGAHGCIDNEHTYVFEGELSLAFPRTIDSHEAALTSDREALSRLKNL